MGGYTLICGRRNVSRPGLDSEGVFGRRVPACSNSSHM